MLTPPNSNGVQNSEANSNDVQNSEAQEEALHGRYIPAPHKAIHPIT
jgi:hypothetical protein